MFTARPCVVEASASATRGGRRARGDVVVVVSRVVVRRFSSSRASVGARDDAGERVGEKAREREEKMDDGDVGAAPREGARRRARGSGTGRMNTHASSGRFAARASAAEARERVSGTGEGGGGEAATAAATDEETANGAKTVPKPRPKSKPRLKSKPKQTSEREEWWKTLDDEACDPITLEPLSALAHAPFELGEGAGEDARGSAHMFDGAVLAEYVTESKCFENPLTREPMDVKQCRALDAYLAKWKLKRFSVEKAFNAALKEKREAEANAERRGEQHRLRMQREREDLRTSLAQTMFTSLRERASAERGGGGGGAEGRRRREGRQNEESGVRRSTSVSDALADLQADGRFAFVDDDLSMLRDVSLAEGRGADARGPRPQDHASLASWGGWSRPSHIENRGNDFPELPGASMSRSGSGNWVAPVPVPDGPRGGDAFPTLGAGSSRSAPSWGTFAPKQSAADRIKSIPRNKAANIFSKKVANSAAEPPAQAQEQASTSAPADEATARRNKLAEAFGVSNPNERPSMFGESSASAFTRKQLELARKHPTLVTRLESTLEDIVTGKSKRRVSMEPMNREMRELCHVVAELYGITSASFGAEPNRHIDFFAGGNKGGALPSIRLSDAVLVDLDTTATKESPASLTRPQDATEYFEGYTKQFSKGEYERLALQFTDITVGVSGVKASLREFAGNYVLEEINDEHVIAHFWKHGTLLQASGKLGGGMRGTFRVKILEKKAKGKEPAVEAPTEDVPSTASASTSARLFRASTASRSRSSAPVEGQAAIDEALNMFGF